jgi:hypothetical protein
MGAWGKEPGMAAQTGHISRTKVQLHFLKKVEVVLCTALGHDGSN